MWLHKILEDFLATHTGFIRAHPDSWRKKISEVPYLRAWWEAVKIINQHAKPYHLGHVTTLSDNIPGLQDSTLFRAVEPMLMPYPIMWLDWFDSRHDDSPEETSRHGVLVVTEEATEVTKGLHAVTKISDMLKEKNPGLVSEDNRENFSAYCFSHNDLMMNAVEFYPGDFPVGLIGWGLNPMGFLGRLNGDLDKDPVMSIDYSMEKGGESTLPDMHGERFKRMQHKMYTDYGMAIHSFLFFLHTKNIYTQSVYPSPKLNTKRKKKNKPLLTTYKTLVLRMDDGRLYPLSQPTGRKNAFHGVQGHFKHYGPKYNRGLRFGKQEGRFYIPNHFRGNRKKGKIVKGYELDPSPQE